MELKLPAALVSVVEPGAAGSYPFPHVDERGALATEPGERVLTTLTGEVRCSVAILSPRTTILVTNHRCAWIDPRPVTSGAWLGGEVETVRAAAPARGTTRATDRHGSRGTAAGHVRHEWVTELRLRRQRSLTGDVDAYLDLVSVTARGARTVTWWLPSSEDASAAAGTVVDAVARRWLEVGADLLGDADRSRVSGFADGTGEGVGDAWTTRWAMPEVTGELLERFVAAAGHR